MAYVGTSASVCDVLPTQVDLPPGNGSRIHPIKSIAPPALSSAGVLEQGTSPNCLVVNATGTRLYSTNETDRVGEGKEGTLSAAINRRTGG
jgi:hypothetical protein